MASRRAEHSVSPIRMATQLPKRITWAVDQLAVQPGERILEIGCGRGVAAALVCERLGDGHVTAIDRSAVAIEAAEERNREHVRAGRAAFIRAPLADARLDAGFDTIFAINVNVFWLRPRRELEIIRAALSREGRLYLFYEAPSSARLEHVVRECGSNLRAGGFVVERVVREGLPPQARACIVASKMSAIQPDLNP